MESESIKLENALSLISKDDEIASLRAALITVGRAVGGSMTEDVSSEFLLNIPDEVKLFISKIKRISIEDLILDMEFKSQPAEGLEGDVEVIDMDDLKEYLECQ